MRKANQSKFRCGDCWRAAQHETDHLNGILFIDRMDRKSKNELRDELDQLKRKPRPA